LNLRQVGQLARHMGAAEGDADSWWRSTLGLPGAVVGHIRAFKREQTMQPFTDDHLPPTSRQIFLLLQENGALSVHELATMMGVGHHAVVDHCEVLFAEDLIKTREEQSVVLLLCCEPTAA
ncbi:MAG: helix-turn-helix transcriptional regulator, partial [Proteobacteria bacterium]|nr:helix-turn-helix transcriptional regulator [Pseudomonadota bacterium]